MYMQILEILKFFSSLTDICLLYLYDLHSLISFYHEHLPFHYFVPVKPKNYFSRRCKVIVKFFT